MATTVNGTCSARAVVYCRVSSQGQLKGLSLDTQEEACRAYCDQHGIEVAEVFMERGESATTADRTELQRMLSYCRKQRGQIHFVVVYVLDRFARNQYDHHALKAFLAKLGVTLRSVAQPIDDSATGLLMDGILAAFSEFDNNLRRERCVSGMLAAASRGRWIFPPPLGYRIALKRDGSKTIEPDPEVAPLIARAFEMAASGLHGVAQVVREMRVLGLRGKKGGAISTSSVHTILRKPIYRGRVSIPEWGIDVPGDFAPLVDEATFTAVQAALSNKRPAIAPYKLNHPDFPLRRFVRCGHCSKPLTGGWSRGRTARYAYYNCPRCRRVNVRRDRLDASFVSLLVDLSPRPELVRLLSAAVLDRWNEEQRGAVARREAIDRKLEDLRRRKERVVEVYLQEAAIDKETYQTHLARVEEELTLAKMDRYDAELDEFDIEGTLAFAEHLVTRASRLWLEAGLNQRQRLQKLFFPDGLSFDGEAFRTPITCPFFNDLGRISGAEIGLVARTGFEPVLPA